MSAVDYAWGQCTWFVAHALSWLGIGAAGNMGNAKDWMAAAAAKGMQTSHAPVVGAAVVYDGAYPGSEGYGHVGVVTGVNPNGTFQVASDNWGAPGRTHIGTSTLADVEGFILPPSAAAGVGGAQRALSMAGGDPSSVSSVGSAQSQLSATTAGLSLPDLNPFDALSNGWNTVMTTVAQFGERAALILFGGLIILIGIKVLFTDVEGAVTNVVGEAATPDTVEAGPTTSTTTENARTNAKGQTTSAARRVTKTSTRVVKGKKGSGLRGAATRGAVKAAAA